MPIYEYECSKCGAIQEAWQKITDKPLEKCDHCSGKLHKLISHSTFHLKGSGWYATDYAKKPAGGAAPESKAKTTKDSSSSADSSKTAASPKSESD